MKNRLTLPLVPLRGLTVFPGISLHFDVGRPKSIGAVRHAMETDKLIFLCYQNDINVNEPVRKDLAKVGTVAEIRQILNLPDGNIRILVNGLYRGKITRFANDDHFAMVNIMRLYDIPCEDDIHTQVLMRRLFHLVEQFLDLSDRFSSEMLTSLLAINEPGEMADLIVANLPLKPQYKQEILNEIEISTRLESLIAILTQEVQLLEIEKDVMDKVHHNLDQNQRDYVLREKLHVVQEELGEGDAVDTDLKRFRQQLDSRELPSGVVQKLEDEMTHLSKSHPFSQEYGVIENYIETVLSLPWEKKRLTRLRKGFLTDTVLLRPPSQRAWRSSPLSVISTAILRSSSSLWRISTHAELPSASFSAGSIPSLPCVNISRRCS